MASGDKNERHQSSSSRGKSTTKSKGGKSTTKSRGKSTVFTSSPSHYTIPPLHPPSHGPSSKSKGELTVSTLSPSLSSIPPLHPPSQGPSSFSHSFYGTMPPQGYSSMPPPGYSSMPPLVYSSMPPQGYSSMPTQGYSGISTTAPFFNMPPPGCSSMPSSYVPSPGMHSAYLAAMERRPSPETPSSEATRSASPCLSRLNIGSSNSEASPSQPSTPSSVDGPDLPSPGKSDHLRRVRIIADGEGFYPSRPVANAISIAVQKVYSGAFATWGEVPCHTQQAILNEFMKKCTWNPVEDNVIRSNFTKKASSRLSNIFSEARNKGQKPGWLGTDYWEELNKYWATP
ncbi:proline-rich receptor-like protein kinase PERK2 [Lycium barbarum]|uniref:proline-rich receptor-like protein kinase PERK2 n=1 Tax=Lycium barbarum TaxID=112863 RepID=UPI00293EAE23|nr:proline-rich receptor-like protein kinase PERK2 [Lycium barbarum]XP_060208876.1 proline-rich receptor-like protein kinase PERK2 [Lycium barbarum]XP_060208877.1 proline-rich receptor-like protein kinase PERK2 [Lycium barbarum]